ncbi:hypothetical protein [Ideonella sp.]|uniref:hypothetical protein n=1 Tax=Ideonella sp. TaxID=1929293 RepID=UPI0035AED212
MFVVFLLVLVGLNIWMTQRVLDAGPTLDHKGLLVAAIWLVPLMGVLMVRSHLRNRAPLIDSEMPPPPPAEPAPATVAPAGHSALALDTCLRDANGWPVFDWGVVGDWLAGFSDEAQRERARVECQRAWLMHLRDALGPYATLHETDDAFVLSTLDPGMAKATSDFVARSSHRIAKVLGPLAAPRTGHKSILVVFDDEADYYPYTAAYDASEGESAFSGGMFIDAGCPHFVTCRADLSRIEPVIVHELTHAALSHLKLPLWLDEGIAVNTEHRLTGMQRSEHTPQQMHRLHQGFWGEAEIQQFWSGESFRRPDDGNKLSYDLARIIVEQLGKDWAAFSDFVVRAERSDAGAEAARYTMDIDLGALVCALLERAPSDAWSPRMASGQPRPATAFDHQMTST